MFTGIIEQIGIVEAVTPKNTNVTLTMKSTFTNELKVDQSLSHNGVCLTIEAIQGDFYTVTAIAETLAKTTISHWKPGDKINLERCLKLGDRLDGHIVQGHVDTIGKCINYLEKNGSWEYTIEIDKKFATLIIEKGSIALNGISLTIFNITDITFTVAIIPYTYEHTNMHTLLVGHFVNVEFDVVGKYVGRRS
jgi:riboflavin synthase